jgi:hypothetical protein
VKEEVDETADDVDDPDPEPLSKGDPAAEANVPSTRPLPFAEEIERTTSKFRDYLLFGHKKEALEYAMKHGLWGHALFLASKMDDRTYSSVMLRCLSYQKLQIFVHFTFLLLLINIVC